MACLYCWTNPITGDNESCMPCLNRVAQMKDSACSGCKTGQPNQQAHMDVGGCLESADDKAERAFVLREELKDLSKQYEAMVVERDTKTGDERTKHVDEMEKVSLRITAILEELEWY